MRAAEDPEFKSIRLGEEPATWSVLRELWENSDDRCPFQSPAVLRQFGANTSDAKRLFALYRDGAIIAGVVLKQDETRDLTFLSDLKTDVNRFLFHTAADEEVKRVFFDRLFQTIAEEDLSLTLNSQYGDREDTGLLRQAAESAGLFCSVVENSACPVVEAASPGELFAHVNGLRELRYRVNRLLNQQEAVFETFADDTELEAWTDMFCATHMRRWADTSTPSSFRNDERRVFLKGCLRAWAADGVLVRFSVRVGEERIGFVIGLRSGTDTIIHHSTTYDPRFAKSSPGKALIHHMAAWMAGTGYRILDFGDGREDYKYTVATGDRPLVRIFIANKSNMRYILSSSVIRLVRGNRFMYDVYQRHIKPRLQA